MPVELAGCLKELNVVGSMSSEEIVNVCLSYIGLKPNLAFKIFQVIFIPSFKSFTFYELIELFMTYWFKVSAKIIHFYK